MEISGGQTVEMRSGRDRLHQFGINVLRRLNYKDRLEDVYVCDGGNVYF